VPAKEGAAGEGGLWVLGGGRGGKLMLGINRRL